MPESTIAEASRFVAREGWLLDQQRWVFEKPTDLAVDAAVAGTGIIYLFEDWLRPYFARGELEPVLRPWWQRFSGPFLYYPGRRLVHGLRQDRPACRTVWTLRRVRGLPCPDDGRGRDAGAGDRG